MQKPGNFQKMKLYSRAAVRLRKNLARLTGFEPVAYCLEGSYSIQLS